MKYIIEVNEDHIKCGDKDSPSHCPVARAIASSTPFNVLVSDGLIELYSKSWEWERALIRQPESVKTFVNKFDQGHQVAPFSFDLEVE